MNKSDTKWDEDPLDYGYILERLPSGETWHMHFGRAAFEYHCELLGRKTNVFASIQFLAKGLKPLPFPYVLTLDGEGIEVPTPELQFNFSWGMKPEDRELQEQARYFQREIMPLLHSSDAMQSAVTEIVRTRKHLRLADPEKVARRRQCRG